MRIDKEFQCRACDYVVSHPIDACPVCQAHFYWMPEADEELSPEQIEEFVEGMNVLVEGRTTREFIMHDGHLWLPHNFWDYCPDGSALDRFSWIRGIRFLQHKKEVAETSRDSLDENSWDTSPSYPIIEQSVPRQDEYPSDRDTRSLPVQTPAKPTAARHGVRPRPAAVSPGSGRSNAFLPVMIFLCFLLLTLSYFVFSPSSSVIFPLFS
jgi:hypothetical protein